MDIRKLARIPAALKQMRADIITLQRDVSSQQNNINELSSKEHYVDVLSHKVDEISDSNDKLLQRCSDLEHIITVSQRSTTPTTKQTNNPGNDRFVDNHMLDQFYIELENNFRGTEDEIKEKQKPYLQKIKSSAVDYKKYPVIDLGSGRGEFIKLLLENDIRGVGVDLNESMVDRMKSQNLEAVNADAIEYLMGRKPNSVGAIVGFHIAEHIPFEQLMTLIAEANRTLVKGGFLLLETPNPENLSVGAFTFYYDPSHLRPIPPAILQFMAKFKGFNKTEILRLQPELSETDINKATTNIQLRETLKRIHGPRDYALIAYK